MEGESLRGLTVVISPLQSLMKDQVENLEKRGIADAVYINGLLSQKNAKMHWKESCPERRRFCISLLNH